MSEASFISDRVFRDIAHYPHGFDRSGVFSRKQADILSRCGSVIQSLSQGDMAPSCPDHERMIAVVMGELPAESDVEKTWMRYLAQLSVKARAVSLCSHPMDIAVQEQSPW